MRCIDSVENSFFELCQAQGGLIRSSGPGGGLLCCALPTRWEVTARRAYATVALREVEPLPVEGRTVIAGLAGVMVRGENGFNDRKLFVRFANDA
jgi:hypothetical protein